jgi:hypothetical protein
MWVGVCGFVCSADVLYQLQDEPRGPCLQLGGLLPQQVSSSQIRVLRITSIVAAFTDEMRPAILSVGHLSTVCGGKGTFLCEVGYINF